MGWWGIEVVRRTPLYFTNRTFISALSSQERLCQTYQIQKPAAPLFHWNRLASAVFFFIFKSSSFGLDICYTDSLSSL
jgi:hypothetical protein